MTAAELAGEPIQPFELAPSRPMISTCFPFASYLC